MGGLYRLAVAVFVVIFVQQISSKKLRSPPVTKSKRPLNSQHTISSYKSRPSTFSVGLIPPLVTLSMPLLANAAAGIPVGSYFKELRFYASHFFPTEDSFCLP